MALLSESEPSSSLSSRAISGLQMSLGLAATEQKSHEALQPLQGAAAHASEPLFAKSATAAAADDHAGSMSKHVSSAAQVLPASVQPEAAPFQLKPFCRFKDLPSSCLQEIADGVSMPEVIQRCVDDGRIQLCLGQQNVSVSLHSAQVQPGPEPFATPSQRPEDSRPRVGAPLPDGTHGSRADFAKKEAARYLADRSNGAAPGRTHKKGPRYLEAVSPGFELTARAAESARATTSRTAALHASLLKRARTPLAPGPAALESATAQLDKCQRELSSLAEEAWEALVYCEDMAVRSFQMIGMDRAQKDMNRGINFSDPMLPNCVDFSGSMLPRPSRGTFPKEWIQALEGLKLEPDCNTAATVKLQEAFKAILEGGDCHREAELVLSLCRADIENAMDKSRLDRSAKVAAEKHAAEMARQAEAAKKLAADKYAADLARSAAAANNLLAELDAERTVSQQLQKPRRRKRAARKKGPQNPPENGKQLPEGPSFAGSLFFNSQCFDLDCAVLVLNAILDHSCHLPCHATIAADPLPCPLRVSCRPHTVYQQDMA